MDIKTRTIRTLPSQNYAFEKGGIWTFPWLLLKIFNILAGGGTPPVSTSVLHSPEHVKIVAIEPDTESGRFFTFIFVCMIHVCMIHVIFQVKSYKYICPDKLYVQD